MGRLIRSGHNGFVLFMTLVTLVMLTISGIAMMRVMEAGVSAAGNIAFRQAAIRVADVGVEDAMAWLKSKSGTAELNAVAVDADGNSIYLPSGADFDPRTLNWEGAESHHVADKVSGYNIYYIIHRMAQGAGSCKTDPNSFCMYAPSSGDTGTTASGSSQAGGSTYAGFITGSTGLVYYRVTVKVSGPRNNVTYVQAFLY